MVWSVRTVFMILAVSLKKKEPRDRRLKKPDTGQPSESCHILQTHKTFKMLCQFLCLKMLSSLEPLYSVYSVYSE